MTSHTVSLHWTWSTSWLNKVDFSTAPCLQSSHYKSLQAAAAWFFSLKHSKRAVSLLLCCDWSVAVTMFNYSNDLSWVEAPGVTIVWSRQWQHPGHRDKLLLTAPQSQLTHSLKHILLFRLLFLHKRCFSWLLWETLLSSILSHNSLRFVKN